MKSLDKTYRSKLSGGASLTRSQPSGSSRTLAPSSSSSSSSSSSGRSGASASTSLQSGIPASSSVPNNPVTTTTTTTTSNSTNNNSSSEKLDSIVKSYKTLIILLILVLILCIIGYFISFSYRESKALYELGISKSYMLIESQVNTKEHREKKLCDFYVSSAYRPYMVKNQRFDYCSLKVMKEILMGGIRCVYLDIFNNTLNENAYPIVTTGIKEGEWKLGLNSLNFEDVCVLIASTVFSAGYVNNHRDPFIICLNLNTNRNMKCLNRIKKILFNTFRNNLLSNNYTYAEINMGEVKIKELLDKVIIFTSDGYQNSELEELINYTWNKEGINKISFKSLDPSVPDTDAIKYSSESLKDFNKNNMTLVVPNESSWFTSNYNPEYGWDAGCQMVFINYNKSGPNFDEYITKFRNDSFLPKPNNMISLGDSESVSIKKLIKKSDKTTGLGSGGELKCPE